MFLLSLILLIFLLFAALILSLVQSHFIQLYNNKSKIFVEVKFLDPKPSDNKQNLLYFFGKILNPVIEIFNDIVLY